MNRYAILAAAVFAAVMWTTPARADDGPGMSIRFHNGATFEYHASAQQHRAYPRFYYYRDAAPAVNYASQPNYGYEMTPYFGPLGYTYFYRSFVDTYPVYRFDRRGAIYYRNSWW